MRRKLFFLGLLAFVMLLEPGLAFADEGGLGYIPIGAGIGIGIAVLGGGLGQGRAIAAGLEAVSRNPSAAGKITTPMYVGLTLVESLVILSFVVTYGMLP